jgi:hypothetical protein
MDKRIILLIITIILSLGLFYFENKTIPISPPVSIFSESHSIVRIHPLTGHEYDLLLKDGRRVLARLRVITTPEARKKVIELINSSKNPRVELIHKEADTWEAEIYLMFNGTEISLTEWLQKNHLTWE